MKKKTAYFHFASFILCFEVCPYAQVPKLEIKESKERGIYVNGLGQHVITGMQDMMKKLQVRYGHIMVHV
jgi:hypothetical protein